MIEWNDYAPGDYRVSCPACGRSPKDKTMGVTVAGEKHGVAHCFRCGHVETRHDDRDLTPAQRQAYARRMEALRKQHNAEKRQRQVQAAAEAAVRWASSVPADDHPYLHAKGVRALGIRAWKQSLLIPLRDAQGRLHNLQSIAADGDKRFLSGGRVEGCYHAIGRPSGEILICEGYATGATLHGRTGYAVAIAFNAGNLLPVAKVLRTKYPCLTLTLAADDDWKTEGNPGLTLATAAARAVGGKLAVPNFSGLPRGDKDTDFNDLARLSPYVEQGVHS